MLTSQTIVSIDLRCLIMVSIMIMIVVVFMALLVIMAVMVIIMVFMIVMMMIIVMMIIMVVVKVVMVHAEVADKVPAEGVVTGPGPGHQVLVLSHDTHQPLQPQAGQTQQEVGSLLNRKWDLES